MSRAEVLREVAAAVLDGAELLAAHSGHREPPERRGISGLYAGGGHYVVQGDVVDIAWRGVTEVVPLAELYDVAAAQGSPAAVSRLQAAIADLPKAVRDAERYIRKHGPDGGMYLSDSQQRAPEWLAIRDRLGAAQTARALWWAREPPAGEQLDLFEVAPG